MDSEEVIKHLQVIEAQNNAIMARQGCLGGMLVILGAERGKKIRELCEKYYKEMGEAFDKYYTQELEKIIKSE